jgi:hypothetical protein
MPNLSADALWHNKKCGTTLPGGLNQFPARLRPQHERVLAFAAILPYDLQLVFRFGKFFPGAHD